MPPAGPDAARRGSPRRDPVVLIAVAAVLLVARVALGIVEERAAPAPEARGPAPAAGPMRWRTLGDGIAESRATGRPVLYDFTAEWCPPCRMMERDLFQDPGAAAALERSFVPVRVMDRQREDGRNVAWVDSLQRTYRVQAFPTLVVTGPAGTGEARRNEGYVGRTATMLALGAGRTPAR